MNPEQATTSAIVPTAVYQQSAVAAPRVVFVPDPYNPNNSVAIPAEYANAPVPYQPRDLTPQPILDPVAQRMVGAGVGGGALAAGVGWGTAQIVGAVAAAGSGVLFWVAIMAIAAKTLPAVARRPRIHNETHVHNTNRWLGRSTTNVQQR